MSRSTISTFQLFAMFPPSGPVCPACGSGERISALGTCATRKPGFYRCLPCGFDFTVRTNTVMERSKVPLHKWVIYMTTFAFSSTICTRPPFCVLDYIGVVSYY